ncbi:hypothetical protein QL285_077720 [Trifolium repens]|nr:hypothetical protein QL285_077720 [Trifolium repens]
MPTPGTGVMNLKTLLHRLFLGLRHHHSERLFSSSSTVIQEIDSCLSLFLISINSMLNFSNILTIPILLQNLQIMSNIRLKNQKKQNSVQFSVCIRNIIPNACDMFLTLLLDSSLS